MIKCAAKHLDTNRNGQLERSELEAAIESLPWLSKGVLKVIGSIDMIMSKCDANGDGAIDMKKGGDMDKSAETCLKTCFKRKAFKSAFFPDCGADEL
ncbi:hypothetical protein TrCOL_g10090 [Triparma columacea]|uniref:EF-hand domain-containing protein n=1 Tax=Triparma columacea TaxID=722753 RepID=A0A9W7G9S7_9STRA|nr:hypothetical protein TrCOL_g10090 [Triparma columacea]